MYLIAESETPNDLGPTPAVSGNTKERNGSQHKRSKKDSSSDSHEQLAEGPAGEVVNVRLGESAMAKCLSPAFDSSRRYSLFIITEAGEVLGSSHASRPSGREKEQVELLLRQ